VQQAGGGPWAAPLTGAKVLVVGDCSKVHRRHVSNWNTKHLPPHPTTGAAMWLLWPLLGGVALADWPLAGLGYCQTPGLLCEPKWDNSPLDQKCFMWSSVVPTPLARLHPWPMQGIFVAPIHTSEVGRSGRVRESL